MHWNKKSLSFSTKSIAWKLYISVMVTKKQIRSATKFMCFYFCCLCPVGCLSWTEILNLKSSHTNESLGHTPLWSQNLVRPLIYFFVPWGNPNKKTDPLEKDFASTGKYVYYFQTYLLLSLPLHSSISFEKLWLGKQNWVLIWEDGIDKKAPKLTTGSMLLSSEWLRNKKYLFHSFIRFFLN